MTSIEYPINMRFAYLAFRGLVRLFSKLVDNQKVLEKKVNELEYAKSQIESAPIYVEEQLNTLQAALSALSALLASMPSTPPPALVAPMTTHSICYPILLMQSLATAPAFVVPVFAHIASSAPAFLTLTPLDHNALSVSNQSHISFKGGSDTGPSNFLCELHKRHNLRY